MPQTTHRQEMAALLAHRDQEGLTYAELAEQTGYSKSTLSWWNWRLRRDARSRFAEVSVSEDACVVSHAAQRGITIRIESVSVEVPPGFDDDTLLRVLALVRQSTC